MSNPDGWPSDPTYAPEADGLPDPGEVVWASVPFEDRPGKSKDRPVLIVGRRDRSVVLGLQLSTQPHRAHQDGWLPLGNGPLDRQGRDSFVRLDRVLELRPESIRREGSVLDEARFRYISSALRAWHGWE